jgi:hypothetical protein
MEIKLRLTAPLSHPGGLYAHGADVVCQRVYEALRSLGYDVGPMDAELRINGGETPRQRVPMAHMG